MSSVMLLARLVLALVFLVASFAKLADVAGSRQALRAFGVPEQLATPFGVWLPLADLAVGVALLLSVSAWWGAIGAAVLLLLGVAGISSALSRGCTPHCHCYWYGQLHAAPAGPSTLMRTLGLAVLTGLVIGFGRTNAGPDLWSWLGTLEPLLRIELIGGLAVLVVILWLLWQVQKQQGQQRLRLEAVEADLAAQTGRAESRQAARSNQAPTRQGQPAVGKQGDAVSEVHPPGAADVQLIPGRVLGDAVSLAHDPDQRGTPVPVRSPLGVMPFLLGENGTIQPHTSYLICATQRSGSYLLCDALQHTGLAGQPIEYFAPIVRRYLSREWGIASESEYLHHVRAVGTTPNGVLGMKVHMNQFRPLLLTLQQLPGYRGQAVPQILSSIFPNLSYIWITRRDKVQQAVSYLKARQTGLWWLTDWTPLSAGEPPAFDFEAIERTVQWIEEEESAWQDYFIAHAITPLVVIYEELVQSYATTACQVLEYLHIPHPKDLVIAEPRLRKQADRSSEEWVERYLRMKRVEQLASCESPQS